MLAPPNVPADRLATLRGAFEKMVVDPDFLAEAGRRSIYIEPMAGADVQKVSDAIIKTPKESSAWWRRRSMRRDRDRSEPAAVGAQ